MVPTDSESSTSGPDRPTPSGRRARSDYPRMFARLRPFEPPGASAEARYEVLRGIAQEFRTEGAEDEGPEGDNTRIPAGYTYFGQFLAHDLTFDPTVPPMHLRGSAVRVNHRTPRLDLDSVYGGGPSCSPELYEYGQRGERTVIRFRVGRAQFDGAVRNFRERDLPRVEELLAGAPAKLVGGKAAHVVEGFVRAGGGLQRARVLLNDVDPAFVVDVGGQPMVRLTGQQRVPLRSPWAGSFFADPERTLRRGGAAVIADPRNDENTMVGQIHLAFLQFHNRAAECLAEAGRDGMAGFEEARRITRWHYQWLVVHDYLRRLLEPRYWRSAVGCVAEPAHRARRHAWRGSRGVPLEFAHAALRFGHVAVRSQYRLNDLIAPKPLFHESGADNFDLRGGGKVLPARWTVQWDRFLDAGGAPAQRSRKLGLRIAAPLRRLPPAMHGPDRDIVLRNLVRGCDLALPSGQDVARVLDAPRIARREQQKEPLWIYVLREAAEQCRGEQLGAVGSHIVGEVICGLLREDADSYVVREPKWSPAADPLAAEIQSGAGFELPDFLRAAGMPISADDVRGAL